jgi:hypothetical protein
MRQPAQLLCEHTTRPSLNMTVPGTVMFKDQACVSGNRWLAAMIEE